MSANKLIIVESPAKARTIQKFVGRSYTIKATLGHIRDLPKSKLGIDVENDFSPSYIQIKGKGPIVSQLKKAVAESEEIYLASDPDREGEAIAWHLRELLKLKSPWRIELHEITDRAVKEALKNPRSLNMNRVNAQQARRVLDRLVGYKLSPLLWRKVKRGLSAGRVQSVAVKLICDREKEVQAFVSQEYWSLHALLEKAAYPPFKAQLSKKAGEKINIPDEKTVQQIIEQLKKGNYLVTAVSTKEQKRISPPPFITSTLQQEASHKLNFKVSRTMRIAQQLYEGVPIGDEGVTGLITYMRTDSVKVSELAVAEAKAYIAKKFGSDFVGVPIKRKASPKAQEAHEAIRPTSIFRTPDEVKAYLSPEQHRLYSLIWERFLVSQMAFQILEVTSAEITCKDYLFTAQGRLEKFAGFAKVLKEEKKEEELPPLLKGEKLKLRELQPAQHFTQPPPRFTEALLIKTLEENGIGRPSTYSPIVETIQKRGYVKLEEKKFFPTDLGVLVNQLLTDHFPQIISVDFTAQIEEKFDEISEGKTEWLKVVKDFYLPFAEVLSRAENEISKVQVPLIETGEKCEKCGKPMVMRSGPFGRFLACSGFPECKSTRPYIEELNIDCPKAGCGGKVVGRNSRKGKTFYGCSRYPECNFVSWYKPTGQNCKVCGQFMVWRYARGGRSYPLCGNPECPARSKKKKTDK